MSTTNTTSQAATKPAVEQTPAVAWVNPMTRFDGSRVSEGAYVLRAVQDITLKAGDTLAVFQTKGGSYVVKARSQKKA